MAWLIPFANLAPAYARPRPLTARSTIQYQPLALFFEDEIELLGYVASNAARPGQEQSITLCWQAVRPVRENYSVLLEIVGPDGQGYGRLETYPGRGNYATSFWSLYAPFCDQYSLHVGADFPAPALARLQVSLLRGVHGSRLAIREFGGASWPRREVAIPVEIERAGRPTALARAADYRFGNQMALRGYELEPLSGERPGARVSLLWEALSDIAENYVVFVHLRDTPQHAFAQDDSQPRQGWYPTWAWQAGEWVLDEHVLYFPQAGRPALDLYVGVYRVKDDGSLQRLPAFDAQGRPVLNDEVILARGLQLP